MAVGGADFDPDDDALGDLVESFELSDQRGRGCPDLLSRPAFGGERLAGVSFEVGKRASVGEVGDAADVGVVVVGEGFGS